MPVQPQLSLSWMLAVHVPSPQGWLTVKAKVNRRVMIKKLSQEVAQQQWVRRTDAASQAEKRAVTTQVLHIFL